MRVSQNNVEQIIRPTGLLDPKIDVRPVRGQIDDLIDEIRERVARHERVLVTTLTKRMAEDLTDHLLDAGMRVNYKMCIRDSRETVRSLSSAGARELRRAAPSTRGPGRTGLWWSGCRPTAPPPSYARNG